METLSFTKLLSYGAIGLGCILAVLTYFLLHKEQEQPKPRKQMLTACYVFMGFSLILTAFGFGGELWRDSAAREGKTASEKVVQLESELEKTKGSQTDLQQRYSQSEQKLTHAEQELTTIRTATEGSSRPEEWQGRPLGGTKPGFSEFRNACHRDSEGPYGD